MHATHEIDAKNVNAPMLHWDIIGKITVKILAKQTLRPMMEMNAVKNFLKNIKHFAFKDTVLFVKILILIMIKIGTNNLKCIYFIIVILHSTSIERELQRIKFKYNMLKYLRFQLLKHIDSQRIRGSGDCRESLTKHKTLEFIFKSKILSWR